MKEKTTVLSQNIGVDVSKDNLDTNFSVMLTDRRIKVKGSRRFANTPSGFAQLWAWVAKKSQQDTSLSVTMEATGVYYECLAFWLYERKVAVSVVLPSKAKYYLKSLGFESKTDKIDAKGLAQMGLEQRLQEWGPASAQILELRSMTRQLEALNVQRTALGNQLHGLSHAAYTSKQAAKAIKTVLRSVEKAINELEKAIEKHIAEDPEICHKAKCVMSIPGVGAKTTAVIIAETNGFATFENAGQLASYAGYDIIKNQSGKKDGQSRMSKKGNAHTRRAMHMPAFSAVRHGVAFKDFHQRLLGKGKKKMQAYVAVQRKLLLLVMALWKKQQHYDPNHGKNQGPTGFQEHKPSFRLALPGPEDHQIGIKTGNDYKMVASEISEATQDGLPYDQAHEALFSVKQN